MIRNVITLALLLSIGSANAQQIIEKHMSFSGKESVALKIQIADSINIQTWNKNEVFVRGSVNVNDNKDNEAYFTSFSEDGRSITVDGKFRDNYFKGKKNCCVESEIYWQVFIPDKAGFTVETINGNITIKGNTTDMNVKSISGYIDLAVPSDKSADVELSTISGSMYSNLDLDPEKGHSGIPMKISQRLNRGGEKIRLETISGDIYFRKSN